MKRVRPYTLFVLAAITVSLALGVAWGGDYADLEVSDENSDENDDYAVDSDPQRPRAVGVMARVESEAAEMISSGNGSVWGHSGRLTPTHLTNAFFTIFPNGRVAGFNVLDAEGFADHYKCNLFVFELAFRSGLRLPMMPRLRGWGYPGPEEVLRQVERGFFDRRWATSADHLDGDELRAARLQGVPFILVARGQEGRAGHMGFIDEVHAINKDGIGRILSIEYSGWEANGDGAHYRRRRWTIYRFETIHILELREPEQDQDQCFAVGRPAAASDLDASRYAAAAAGVMPPNVVASP